MSLRHHLPFSDFLLLLRSQGLVMCRCGRTSAAARLFATGYDGGRPDELATAIPPCSPPTPTSPGASLSCSLHYAPGFAVAPLPLAVKSGAPRCRACVRVACARMSRLLLLSRSHWGLPAAGCGHGALSRFDAGTRCPMPAKTTTRKSRPVLPSRPRFPPCAFTHCLGSWRRCHPLPDDRRWAVCVAPSERAPTPVARDAARPDRQLARTACYQLALRDLRPPLPHEDSKKTSRRCSPG